VFMICIEEDVAADQRHEPSWLPAQGLFVRSMSKGSLQGYYIIRSFNWELANKQETGPLGL
jgi:hypothetical protein